VGRREGGRWDRWNEGRVGGIEVGLVGKLFINSESVSVLKYTLLSLLMQAQFTFLLAP